MAKGRKGKRVIGAFGRFAKRARAFGGGLKARAGSAYKTGMKFARKNKLGLGLAAGGAALAGGAYAYSRRRRR